MKHIKLVVAATALLSASLVEPSAADAATRCLPGSNTHSGRCFTTHRIYRDLKVVEAVPLVNRSRRTATFHCSFTRTITRTVAAGASVSAEVKATLFKLVDASTSIAVHQEVTQTASQATQAGLSVRLRPRQSATCQRTYGHVRTRITDTAYSGSRIHRRRYSVKVPSFLGVRLVD